MNKRKNSKKLKVRFTNLVVEVPNMYSEFTPEKIMEMWGIKKTKTHLFFPRNWSKRIPLPQNIQPYSHLRNLGPIWDSKGKIRVWYRFNYQSNTKNLIDTTIKLYTPFEIDINFEDVRSEGMKTHKVSGYVSHLDKVVFQTEPIFLRTKYIYINAPPEVIAQTPSREEVQEAVHLDQADMKVLLEESQTWALKHYPYMNDPSKYWDQ